MDLVAFARLNPVPPGIRVRVRTTAKNELYLVQPKPGIFAASRVSLLVSFTGLLALLFIARAFVVYDLPVWVLPTLLPVLIPLILMLVLILAAAADRQEIRITPQQVTLTRYAGQKPVKRRLDIQEIRQVLLTKKFDIWNLRMAVFGRQESPAFMLSTGPVHFFELIRCDEQQWVVDFLHQLMARTRPSGPVSR